MILPNDPFEFIVPASHGIRNPGWELDFGRYRWFYVVGAKLLMSKAGIHDYSHVRDMASSTVAPAAWQATYPAFDWTSSLAANQINHLINKDAMCFDRACLGILALLRAVDKLADERFKTRTADDVVSRWLKIKPAVHEIQDTPPLHVPIEHVHRALAAGSQRNSKLLKELHEGRGATHQTLAGIATYLHANGVHTTDQVAVKLRRGSNAKGTLTAARHEVVQEQIDPATGEII